MTTTIDINIEYPTTDISEILAVIQNASFSSKWTPGDFQTLCQTPGVLAQIASVNSDKGYIPVAYSLYRTVAEEAEILSLGVLEDFRKQTIAEKMLKSAMTKFQDMNIEQIFLEVAADNMPAIYLYNSAGFKRTGRRKNYYNHDGIKIDALIMSKFLT